MSHLEWPMPSAGTSEFSTDNRGSWTIRSKSFALEPETALHGPGRHSLTRCVGNSRHTQTHRRSHPLFELKLIFIPRFLEFATRRTLCYIKSGGAVSQARSVLERRSFYAGGQRNTPMCEHEWAPRLPVSHRFGSVFVDKQPHWMTDRLRVAGRGKVKWRCGCDLCGWEVS